MAVEYLLRFTLIRIDMEEDNLEQEEVEETKVSHESVNPLHEEDILCSENTDKKKEEAEPLFRLEPKKDGCLRNDKLRLLGKKVGFFGLVGFLLLSILFGALTRVFENSLNLLFMALAILAYGVQNLLEYLAEAKCNCTACHSARTKQKTIIIASVVGFVLFLVLFFVRQFVGF